MKMEISRKVITKKEKHMSTIETILDRAMSEPDFAQQLFEDADQALHGYNLTAEEFIQIKSISQAKFADLQIEERKSLASTTTVRGGGFFQIRDAGG
jgi:hypothetical protein